MTMISVQWRRARQGGFTLLELLVVLLIIALLAGYVGPKLFSQVDKAKVKATQAQMKTLGDALVQYRLDVGSYPSSEQGLDALVKAPPGVAGWHGPYLAQDVPLDAWGRPYQLQCRAARPRRKSCPWARKGEREAMVNWCTRCKALLLTALAALSGGAQAEVNCWRRRRAPSGGSAAAVFDRQGGVLVEPARDQLQQER